MDEKYIIVYGQYLVNLETEEVHEVLVQGDGHELGWDDLLEGGVTAIFYTDDVDVISISIVVPNDKKAEEILQKAKDLDGDAGD